MKQVIALKLLPTLEQAQALRSTMEAFNAACNYLAGIAWEHRMANKYKLQELEYKAVREQFGLSSQLTVRAIAKTCEAFKRDKNIKPQFKPHGAITYDARLMSFKGLDTVSLLTMEGRALVKMVFGQYQAGRMDRIRGQADLILRNGVFYLYATIDLPEPPQTSSDEFLGIDLGVANIAADSDGEVHSGKVVNAVRHRHRRLRAKLQKKGTKSARRRLKKLSGKERRFAKDVNHVLSKRIVAKALDTGRAIAVEELTKIRERITVRRRQRATLHSWSFHQLRFFLEYKAAMAGVMIVAVNPSHGCLSFSNP